MDRFHLLQTSYRVGLFFQLCYGDGDRVRVRLPVIVCKNRVSMCSDGVFFFVFSFPFSKLQVGFFLRGIRGLLVDLDV